MRTIFIAILVVATACGKKAPPSPPAAEAPAPTPIAEAPPAPTPVPAPDGEPEVESNADYTVELTFADGRIKAGKVIRVERGADWYAEKGWVDTPLKLTVSLDANGKGRDAGWGDIREVKWSYPGTSAVDCTFDSDFTPAMYMCVMKSTAKVTTTDGATWDGLDRYKWRFTFDDGTTETFHVAKLPVREQTTKRLDDEDYALYEKLQGAVVEGAGKAVTKLVIGGE